jgi:hypothetical protein
MVQPKDTGIMVEMANAITAGVKRPIDFFHMPVPKGRTDDSISRRSKNSSSVATPSSISASSTTTTRKEMRRV